MSNKLNFLCLIFTFLLCVTDLQAQNFKAGLKAGFCASQVSGDNLSGFDKAGIVAGAFVANDFSRKTGLQMEIIFIQKGSRRRVSEDDNSFYRLRLHYAEVPVLFLFRPSKKITLTGGLSAGVLIHAEEANQLGVIYNTPPFNKLEISTQLGIRFILSDHWAADLRHSNSLTTVRDFEGSYNYYYFEKGQYNTAVHLTLHYTF
jgi:hypothetical protein